MTALRGALGALAALPHRFPGVSWSVFERAGSLLLAFAGTVLLSRYLGVEGFGAFAYASALVSLFLLTSTGGLTGLVIRNFAQRPAEAGPIFGTALTLRLGAALLAYAALLAFTGAVEGPHTDSFLLCALLGLPLLLKPFDVFDYRLQAASRFRDLALARLVVALAGFGLKLALVLGGASLLAFAAPPLAQGMVAAALFCLLVRRTFPHAFRGWRWDGAEARALLGQGGVIFLSSLAAVLYLKVDQLMLKWLLGVEAVGLYAVAASLSEGWYFLPAAIVSALFPRLVALRGAGPGPFEAGLQRLLRGLFFLALAIAVLVQLLGTPLVTGIFGPSFAAAAPILKVHIWAGLFVFMREAFSKWLLLENLLVFSLLTHGLGALTNIALNSLLIPRWGGLGAAYATLISYAVAAYFSLALSRRTRPFFAMMTRAMVPARGRGQGS